MALNLKKKISLKLISKVLAFAIVFSCLGVIVPRAWGTQVNYSPAINRDTYARQASPTTNYGNGVKYDIFGTAGNFRRGYLSFNTSAIPLGAKVETATLNLHTTSSGVIAGPISVLELTRSWVEGTGAAGSGATWNTYDGATAWTTPGGDYSTAVSASTTVSASLTWYSWNVMPHFQDWANGTVPNNGFIIKAASEPVTQNATIDSSETATPASRPNVTLAYIIGDTTISPGSAYTSTSTAFSVRLSNTAGASGDQMNEATFTIPAGYTSISSASASATAFGKTWTITTQPGAGGPTIVKATASSAANDLTNGQSVDVTFTAITPGSPGLTTWNSGNKGAAGGWYSDATPATVMISIMPDTTPPVTTLSTLPLTPDGDAGWFKTNPTITLTADEPGATYYKWGSAGTTQTYSGSFAGIQGQNSLYYWSVDTANNTETPKTQVFKVDSNVPTDPTTVGSSSHTTGTPSSNPAVTVDFSGATDTASGVEGYSASWSLGATATPPATLNTSAAVSTTTSPSLTPDGDWWFNLRTKDNAGNWTSTVHLGPFAIDTAAPVTTLSSTPSAPDGDGGWFKTNPALTLTRDEPGATYYKWGSAGTTQTYSGSFAGIQGQNTLYYWSVDTADNTETPAKTQAYKIDSNVPTDPTTVSSSSHTTGTPSSNPAVTVDFSGATDTASGVEGYSASWSLGATATPPATLNTSAAVSTTTSPSLTPDGDWWFNLRTKDNAGNWTSTVHLGPFAIDTAAPVTTLSSTPSAPDGDGGWFKTNPAISLSRDGTGATYYQWDTTTGAWTTYGTSFGAPEGQYTLYYYSVDTAGNSETVNNVLFKVDSGVPTDPTTVSSSSHTTGTPSMNKNVVVNFSGATDATAGVEGYSASWSLAATATPPATVNTSAAVSTTTSPSLTPDGDWWFNLRTKDNAGNWTSTVHFGPFVIFSAESTGSSPHGTYTSSSSLCELCHQTHDTTSTAGQHSERAARIEEDNIDFSYTGAWTTETGGSRSSSSSVDSSQAGATAELTFSGSRVVWVATETSASGRARVSLDGLVQADIDLYGAADDYQAAVWQKTGLAKGSHTITIEVLRTKQAASSGYDVDVDAIDLRVPKIMLLRGQNEKAVCYTCHAGTGSSFNIAEEFGETSSTSAPVSKHPVPEGIVLCSDCHSPHAAAENWDATPEPYEVVRLLRAVYSTFLGFVVRSTNSWLDTPEPASVAMGLPEQRKLSKPYQVCGSCHGAGSTLPGGDLVKYYDYGGSKHDSTVSVPPDTKAEIACLSCHEQHISSLPKLLETTIAGNPITGNDNNVCYSCHIEAGIAGFDTSPGDVHGATDSTKTPGSPGLVSPYDYRAASIRCPICHDPHGSGNVDWTPTSINATSGISVDGTAAANRGQWEGYCAACHTYTHDTTATYDLCVTCHFHGADNDASATTRF